MKIACIFEVRRTVRTCQAWQQHKWPIRRNVSQSRASAFSFAGTSRRAEPLRFQRFHPPLSSLSLSGRGRTTRTSAAAAASAAGAAVDDDKG